MSGNVSLLMAERSRGRSLGRLVTAVGFVWLFWALVGQMIAVELGRPLISVPLLPGIVLLLLGRAIARGSRRRARTDGDEPELVSPLPPRRSSSRPAPAPSPPSRVRPSPIEESKLRPEPELEAQALAEAAERMAEDIADGPKPLTTWKTSAEMVAEARERFGKRP